VVPHQDSTAAFRIAAPSYLNERAIRFQVRLLGLEESWREVESTLVRYVALPAGAYRFEVRAAGGDGVFGAVSALEFRVRPPWWDSWWFYALETLGAVAVVFFVLRFRLRHLARSKTRLEILVAQRTQEMHAANAALQRANEALEEANRALEAQSLTDPLTGLHNRRYLTLVIEDDAVQVQRVYRETGATAPLPNQDMVFLLVDLDDFKVVNDRYGHAMGDAVLRQSALILRRAARESDAVIRWGGEEFLVVARATSRGEAAALAERIRLLMAEQSLVQPGGEAVRWTCSVGFAPFPFQASDAGWLGWERVLEVADACLYAAKQSGRNAWVGVLPKAGLHRERHGARIPEELPLLAQEGVLEVISSRPEPFRPRMGSVMG
jgi:diguanylate cyclase (GGDEF)-like protein